MLPMHTMRLLTFILIVHIHLLTDPPLRGLFSASFLIYHFILKKNPLSLISAAHIHVGLGLFTEAWSTRQRPYSKEMTSLP